MSAQFTLAAEQRVWRRWCGRWETIPAGTKVTKCEGDDLCVVIIEGGDLDGLDFVVSAADLEPVEVAS